PGDRVSKDVPAGAAAVADPAALRLYGV
ncbi:hypothetical protein BN1723_020191, partial [Verticillium longisporum]